VFAARGVEEESDVIACGSLGGSGSEYGERILVFGVAAFRVRDGAFDFEVGDGLKGVVLREGNPEMVCLCLGVRGNVDLIGEAEAAMGFGSVEGRAVNGRRSGVQQECGRRTEKERGTHSEKNVRFGHERNLLASSID
jgi:hypothetical protein